LIGVIDSFMRAKRSTLLETIVQAALSDELSRELAAKLHSRGPAAVTFAMIAAATRIAELEGWEGHAV